MQGITDNLNVRQMLAILIVPQVTFSISYEALNSTIWKAFQKHFKNSDFIFNSLIEDAEVMLKRCH